MSDTWEARMAARTQQRRDNPQMFPQAPTLTNPPAWLNGNHELSSPEILWIWPCEYCICCGSVKGTCTYVITEDYEPPPMPDWPFTFEDCPICTQRRFEWTMMHCPHCGTDHADPLQARQCVRS